MVDAKQIQAAWEEEQRRITISPNVILNERGYNSGRCDYSIYRDRILISSNHTDVEANAIRIQYCAEAVMRLFNTPSPSQHSDEVYIVYEEEYDGYKDFNKVVHCLVTSEQEAITLCAIKNIQRVAYWDSKWSWELRKVEAPNKELLVPNRYLLRCSIRPAKTT